MSHRFSILICSLVEREKMLKGLLRYLADQKHADVEVLTEIDAGELSIGTKRQRLLERAQGDYIAYIDDDDVVSDRYVNLVLGAVANAPDVVGIKGMYIENGRRKKPFIHSITAGRWYETPAAYYRTPNHLNPVRREHALQIGFADRNHGEDHDYSQRLWDAGLLKRETMIHQVLYEYRYNAKTSRSRK
jgi:glycosyltransferase involved in cell wall biosynthesis